MIDVRLYRNNEQDILGVGTLLDLSRARVLQSRTRATRGLYCNHLFLSLRAQDGKCLPPNIF